MRIALIGAHGNIALLAGPLLQQAGHDVSGVVRNPDHEADVREAGMEPVVADVETLDVSGLTQLLDGHDLVIWSAGAGGGSPERTLSVDRDAAIRSMDAAQAAGVDRYVMVSYAGSRPDHGVPQDNPFATYADAKSAADMHLRGSDLGWTILGPSGLTDDPGTGAVELVTADGSGRPADGFEGAQVPRADVAAVLAAAVERPALAGTTLVFNGGDVPVDQALDAVAGGTTPA
ncbi:NAD(P)H-binding protein [Ornithinimicrobium sp. W1665]|uniref:NAD(P)H-binding protein n=1 Tax=Ornithinimicrobium sp. W1665 TaxID=3416666 RepID=UPI003CF0B2D9